MSETREQRILRDAAESILAHDGGDIERAIANVRSDVARLPDYDTPKQILAELERMAALPFAHANRGD